MSEKFAWYLARSSGWVAFVLLAVTVVWGILGITKIIERRGLPRWMLDLHRYIALLTVIFTGVHLAALVADDWLQIAWKEILVPMTISYRPGAVAWGVVAMYLIAAVQITSWCKSRIPRTVWRAVHWLSYPALWMVAVHGLQAGTDAKAMPVRVGVMVITAAVACFTILRVFTGGRKRVIVLPTPRTAAPVESPVESLVEASVVGDDAGRTLVDDVSSRV